MTQLPEHPYPLVWPDEIPRTRYRDKSAFKTALPAAIKNVQDSLRLFAADSGKALSGLQVTSNVGLLESAPADPGVAVWFLWDGAVRCIPVDKYQTVKENLQAVHHILEARRVELRHAGINIVRATFKGFSLALPAPGRRRWHEVLDVAPDASIEAISAAYKARARDLAGRDDQAQLQELNVARDEAMKERG